MPREITDAELTELAMFRAIGSPQEIRVKIKDLETDNFNQREKIRLQDPLLPNEGQLLLSVEDAKKFNEWKALGEPAALKTRLSEGEAAQTEVKSLKGRTAAVEFVRAAGLAEEATDVLVALPALKDATFEVRKKKEKDKAGKDVEVLTPYITLAGTGEKAMSFEDAQEKVPALKGLRPATQETKPEGVGFVRMGSKPTGSEGSSSVFDKIRSEQKGKLEAADKAKPKQGLEERLGKTG